VFELPVVEGPAVRRDSLLVHEHQVSHPVTANRTGPGGGLKEPLPPPKSRLAAVLLEAAQRLANLLPDRQQEVVCEVGVGHHCIDSEPSDSVESLFRNRAHLPGSELW